MYIGQKPDTWDDMTAQQQTSVVCIDLDSESVEYKEVLDLFNKTMNKGSSYSNIVRIQRIQNPRLYQLYCQAKDVMDKNNPPNHPNERRLFHGTDVASAIKINSNGFNRSYAGKHGKISVALIVIVHAKYTMVFISMSGLVERVIMHEPEVSTFIIITLETHCKCW